MTINVSIIGLNLVGASFGLALGEKAKDYYRVGYDRDVKAGPQAVQDKVIDKSSFNLPAAVEKADYIVLAVPAFELKTALQVIGPVLREGAVVVDTSPLKQAAAEWASELIPAGRWFVSVSPTLNPDSFYNPKPSADLFRNSLMVVTAGKGTPEEVVENVISLTESLGAQTQFSDPIEHDGLLAAVHQLPEMAAAALLQAVSEQPGWQESRKMAGAHFAGASAPLQPLAGLEAPAESLFHNRDNALRVLDNLIASLNILRDHIAEGRQKEANEFFSRAGVARKTWLEQRQNGEWERKTVVTQAPDFVSRLFGSKGRPSKK
ncbi:MAG: prephenate dehydrogenase [Anaerolineaceae bacterium]